MSTGSGTRPPTVRLVLTSSASRECLADDVSTILTVGGLVPLPVLIDDVACRQGLGVSIDHWSTGHLSALRDRSDPASGLPHSFDLTSEGRHVPARAQHPTAHRRRRPPSATTTDHRAAPARLEAPKALPHTPLALTSRRFVGNAT